MNSVVLTAFAFLLLHECSGQTCPNDWTYYEGSCYLFVNDNTNWYNSKTICETLRSHLVEVTSAAENNFVTNIVKLHRVENIWSGLQDFAEDGNFVWSSSLQPPDYTHWHANEPNDSGGREDCVEYWRVERPTM
ncbi:C-type lectin domain family 4 member M-like [Pomacea canaliculata]|uniref:C-type lectin domain family 4 member M-like n=1 Tax=Pomacea canaliculata TaxID=400727 RepID=UPI000D72C10A|nr:C-type lectin domain family 4 member M-like [Pomacea canaliculata]XP_025102466.1 C-type lectin domain family 4 member M-like [Pomacea canaliculata]